MAGHLCPVHTAAQAAPEARAAVLGADRKCVFGVALCGTATHVHLRDAHNDPGPDFSNACSHT